MKKRLKETVKSVFTRLDPTSNHAKQERKFMSVRKQAATVKSEKFNGKERPTGDKR